MSYSIAFKEVLFVGLIFIVNPFTTEGQQYWVQKCLQEYTKRPNRLNLDPFNEICPGEELWDVVQRSVSTKKIEHIFFLGCQCSLASLIS